MRLLFSIIALTLCAFTADAQTFLGKLRQNDQGKGHVTVTQSAEIDALVNGKQQQTTTQQQQQTTAKQQSATTHQQSTTTKEPTHIQLVSPTQKKTQDNGQKENTQTTQPAKTNTPANNKDHQVANTQQKEHATTATQPTHKEQEKETKPATKEHATTPATKEHVTSPANSPAEDEDLTPTIDTRKKVMSRSYKTQGYRIQVFSGGNSRKDRQKAENAGTAMKSYFPSEPIYVHFYSPSWKCRMGNYKSLYEARKILAQVKKLGYTQACIVKGTISVQY